MTTSKDEFSAGSSSADAGTHVGAGGRGAEHGAHAFVGLDGGHVTDPLGEEPGQDAGARADFEGVGRVGGQQPVERLGRRPRAEPVVLAGDGTEGAAQHGGVLVLAHVRNLPEGRRDDPVRRVLRRLNQQVSRAVACHPVGQIGRDRVVVPRGSGAVVAHHLAKVRVAGSNPVFRSRNPVL